MFGSNPFGQSSFSPFGSQPIFGQMNDASSNPFAPIPFGSTSPFGSQTGGSIFGGTSTGVFGAQSSSPLSSSSVFGASLSPAFGSSTPTFGASSGSSMFGQKPTFGGFGSTTTQTSPFGASFQQSQPAFGSNVFGSSSPFGAQSQPAFGAQTTPAFGSSSPAFGSTTSPTFGNSSGGFGASSSLFGSSMPTFSASTTPAFGATTAPAFGISTTPAFGATTTSAFGASAPAFGASSTPFNFVSNPAFGQATSTFGNNQVGVSAFGAQTAPFGAQTPTSAFGSPGFGQSTFGAQRGGSRVSPYLPTPETDGATGTQPAGKLESISAMPVYNDKSHEELRWEDYQIGDKGGPAPGSQATSVGGFGNAGFGSMTSSFGQTSANPFSSSTSSNPFAPKPAPFSSAGFGPTPTTPFSSSAFGPSSTSNIFGSTTSATPSLFGSTQTFGVNTSPFFSSSSASGFGSPSIFGASSAQGAKSAFGTSLGFGNTLSSPLFQSTTPTLPQYTAPFGQNSSVYGQTGGGFFSTPATGFANNLFSSTSSLISSNNALGFGQTTPSLAMPFQPAQPMSFGGFNFSNLGQSQSATTNGTSGIFYNGVFAQSSATQCSIVAQAAAIANPFGTLPAMPQMSIGRAGTSPSIQCGIASLPVVEKPAPVKLASPLTSRHLSQRRLRVPVRKYNPIIDRPKVSFFNDEEPPSAPKADALFVPRENPRSLVIRPLEPLHSRSSTEKTRAVGTLMHENENPVQNGDKVNPKASETLDMAEKRNSYITLTGHRAGEAAIAYEHGADVEALMPKLRHSDYFTEPRIQDLAAKERAEPGFCRHVRDFVVGRHSYGSIKFFGETDVRRLDLESLVQFNNREVIVYMDESKKPPVGQGLNKRAEVTLLNIKCFDKKTSQQLTEGPRIEKYREMLRRKGEDQGAEFVSYDAVKGEWKFKVDHFSRYRLGEGEEEEEEGCYE